ncbi:hypothetical protein KAU33_14760 [Candidatus Dependentiae bacterium]|nr:hypothetical protein [Candidatus Dependentiae bacterium]
MLKPEEEIALREKVKKELEEQNKKKKVIQKKRIQEYKNILEREKQVQEIIWEEEETFYSEKGFKKYISRTGNIYWLSPEEYEQKMKKRKSHRRKSRSKNNPNGKSSKLVFDWKYFFAMLFILSSIFTAIFLLIKYLSTII